MMGVAIRLAGLGFLLIVLVVHMAGHYVVARLCGMHLRVGIGPTLLTRTSRTGATFQLRLFPFGAFTEIAKAGDHVDPKDPHAYPNRPAWQRLVMVLAGPAANYLFAAVLAMGLTWCHGIDIPRWYGVGAVMPDYDAHGKLEPGDRIVAVDHVPIYTDSGPRLTDRVMASRGAPLLFTIERNGVQHDVLIKPREERGPSGKPTWRIGVQYKEQELTVEVGVIESARLGLAYPVEQTKNTGKMLYGILFGGEQADPGGPVRMVQELQYPFSAGIVAGISLLMALSAYWALFTLLPLPGGDGGRLVFQLFEVVSRRRFPPRIESRVHLAGIFAWIALNLIALFITVVRLG